MPRRVKVGRFRFAMLSVIFTLNCCVAAGQELPTAESELSLPTGQQKLPTSDQLSTWQKQLSENTELAEEVRTAAAEALSKAADHVKAAQQFQKTTQELTAEIKSLPDELQRLEAAMQQPATSPGAEASNTNDTAALQILTKESEADVAALLAERDAVAAEIKRRAERRPKLAQVIAQLTQQLAETREQRAAATEAPKTPVETADRIRLQTREHRLAAELAMAEQESRTYEATSRLWTLKRDDVERRLAHAQAATESLQKQLAAARQKEADKAAEEAVETAATSLKALRSIAEENAELAKENAKLVEDTAEITARVTSLKKRSDDRSEAFDTLKRRAEAANYSPAIGVLLRVQQTTLPRTDSYAAQAEERQQKISELNVNIIEWETERRSLLDIPAAVQSKLRTLKPEDRGHPEAEEQLTTIFTKRRELLVELVAHAKSNLDELVRLDGLQKTFRTQLDVERVWLAEHVLWVRSTDVLGQHPDTFLTAGRNLLNLEQWTASFGKWKDRAWEQRWLMVLAVTSLTMFVVLRPAIKKQLRLLGETAKRSNCVLFQPTVQAVGYTLLLALPLPLLAIFLGWKTADFGHDDIRLLALGRSLQLTGVICLILEIIRQSVTSGGLGESHLAWPHDTLASLRRTARLLLLTQLVPILFCSYAEFLRDEPLISTWGRVAFLVAMVCAAIAMFRLLHPKGAVVAEICSGHDGTSLLRSTRWLWSGTAIITPVALAVLSVVGYHYTAVRLTGRAATTLCIGLSALLVAALLTRWLLVVYRRLAMQRARERRRQLMEQSAAEGDRPPVPQQIPEVQLDDVNQQTRRLIRLGCGAISLAALSFVWADVLPALGFLEDIHLWQDRLVVVEEGDPQPWVSLGDLFVFALIVVLTIMAARNLPGLMEISVLQRLPMDAGARYAASMISRYVITVCGFVYAFNWIGIGWGSVQWLVAAMTVGLGFGLQEIFANFVSGIILLFERPVRVGDTVTIGDITGTVSRIQIRATTLLDWDNKELIVPNREFVTGNLVNWTLSDPTLRLVCSVGVAYGSNTRLATELLYKVAKAEHEVLSEPEPVVVFTAFGDNSLNFELRVHVNGLTNYRRLRHQINLAIDDEFRRNNIEIAFPQRDLHVRSLPEDISEALRQLKSMAISDPG